MGTDPSLPAVASGSHIDAIPNAGRFDGVVGVLGALAAFRNLRQAGFQPRRSLELIVFTAEEVDRLGEEVRAVEMPVPVRRRLEFFASQFEFCEVAGEQFEYKTKDTARLAGAEWTQVVARDTGRDRLKDLGCQTQNGLSVRTLMTLIIYAKAMAYFRGQRETGLDDLRQILSFVLRDKLTPDPDAPFFEAAGNGALRTDRVGWLRRLFELSNAEYDRLDLDRDDPVGAWSEELSRGLEGLGESEVRARLLKIERLVADRSKGRKLYGHLYDDLLKLKHMHQRYTNYLRWLKTL